VFNTTKHLPQLYYLCNTLQVLTKVVGLVYGSCYLTTSFLVLNYYLPVKAEVLTDRNKEHLVAFMQVDVEYCSILTWC